MQAEIPNRTLGTHSGRSAIAVPSANQVINGEPRWNAWQLLAVGFSFANLAFFDRWTQMLAYDKANAYVMRLPPSPGQYLAMMIALSLIGVLSFAITWFVSQMKPGRLQKLARFAWLLAMLKPLRAIEKGLLDPQPQLKDALTRAVGGEANVPIVFLVAGILVTLAIVLWPSRIYTATLKVLLILAVFAPVTMLQAAWRAARYDASAFLDKPSAALLATGHSAQPRVVWIIFDELDQRLTFDARQKELQLPELDRLRQTSIYASRAYPPAGETLVSLPSLIMGQRGIKARQVDVSELRVQVNENMAGVDWAGQPNIFSQARAMGVNTALVGWYHPYCRLLASALTKCHWCDLETELNVVGTSVTEVLPNEIRILFYPPFAQSLYVREHIRRDTELFAWSRDIVTDESIGLSLLHLHGAHIPYIYNRFGGSRNIQNPLKRAFNKQYYVDGQAHTDRVLGDLRRAMEQAHTWETTTVIVSSDHWFRGARSVDGKMDHRVPFLIKLARQASGASYAQPFNTVVTQDLVLAILRRDVSTPDQILRWLDQHRGGEPVNPAY